MARKKTSQHRLKLKSALSHRLREIRQDVFGEHGGPELARRLNLPARTWYNYETGVTVPAEILLAFIDQTGSNPVWLLTGEGTKYRRHLEDKLLADLSAQDLIRRGLEKLESGDQADPMVEMGQPLAREFVAVRLIDLNSLGSEFERPTASTDDSPDAVMIFRHWLPNPGSTVAVKLEDDAMHPILPAGSIVAIDRSLRNPDHLEGRMVAVRLEDRVMIRWLEVSGRHLILKPNRNIPGVATLALEPRESEAEGGSSAILGQVIWSWSRFS